MNGWVDEWMSGWLRNTRTKGEKIRPHPGPLPPPPLGAVAGRQERGTVRLRVVVGE